MTMNFDDVGFLGFDVFGTVVDWRNGIARDAARLLDKHGIAVDPHEFADKWRSLYQPAMEEVRAGRRNWVKLEVLNRENLDTTLSSFDIEPGVFATTELDDLNRAWERLDPWPDSVEGLTRLKTRFAVGPLSNGHIAGMLNLARYGGLPWDVITGAELTKSYKPQPQTYLGSADAVGLPPRSVSMVAAHNEDLKAARETGLRTVFVCRPTEHGPGQTSDLKPEADWDVVATSLTEVSDILGCK